MKIIVKSKSASALQTKIKRKIIKEEVAKPVATKLVIKELALPKALSTKTSTVS